MGIAVEVKTFGGPDQLSIVDQEPGQPGPGQVLVRNKAIGLNFIDVYHRTGLYPNPLPLVPGLEAAGEVEAVGEGVTSHKPGDRFWCYGPMGTYCETRLMSAKDVLPLPDDIEFDTAAAIMLKGMTAYYLLHLTWPLKAGETILVHAAAGGVGQLVVQWAKALGATVIATAGSAEKCAIAKSLGADVAIDMSKENFTEKAREATNGRGVDVVYDSLGKDTFEASLDCLRPLGMMVSFGNATGPVTGVNLGILAAKGSLFVTRPTIASYFPDPEAKKKAAAAIFDMVRQGKLHINIGQRFALKDAAKAHAALEGRQTTGSTVLVP